MKQDPRNFTFSSDYPMAYFVYDKVVSLTVPANTSSSVLLTVPHNLGFKILPVGYWSTDADFKSANEIGIEALGTSFKSVIVVADNTNFYVFGQATSSSSVKLYVHLWAYMAPDANGHAPAVSDSTNFYFNTDYPYLEIVKSGIVEESSSSDPVEIYHNLGYTPYCRVWKDGGWNGYSGIIPFTEASYNNNISGETITIDNEKLWFDEPNPWSKRYYHIYTSEVQS